MRALLDLVHEYGPETVYGVMIAISVLMMIVLFSSKYSAAEAFCPPELAAYAWFCTACFVYVIAAYEEVSLTQWIPLLVGSATSGYAAWRGSQMAQTGILFPKELVTGWTPFCFIALVAALVLSALGINTAHLPKGVLPWGPHIIASCLMGLAANAGASLNQTSRLPALFTSTVTGVVFCAGISAFLYAEWLDMIYKNNMKVSDWTKYGIAVTVLSLGSYGGSILSS